MIAGDTQNEKSTEHCDQQNKQKWISLGRNSVGLYSADYSLMDTQTQSSGICQLTSEMEDFRIPPWS
jgi:hypothetical protein